MRRGVIYALSALGVVGLLLVAAALWLFWLFNTSSGARFAVNLAAEAAGFDLVAQRVEGRLLDRLTLTGVRLAQPKLTIKVESAALRWEPLRLLQWRLKVRELAVAGVEVQDDRPPTAEPPQFSWPKLPDTLRRLSAQVDSLKLKGLSYRHMDQPPTLVYEISSALTLDDGVLSLSEMLLVSPQGRLSGDIAAGLKLPSLNLDITALPARPVRELDFLSLKARLLPANKPEQLAGGIAFLGKRKGARRLELTGELGIGQNLINLRRFKLSKPGQRGTLAGDVSMLLAQPEPLFNLALKADRLDLAEELDFTTDLTGTLTFSGSLSKFAGDFNLVNRGEGWQDMALVSRYRGEPGGVKFSQLSGKVLQGSVKGALQLAWKEGTQVSGNLSGRGINPEVLADGWPGKVNLDLAGNLIFPKEGPAKGEVRAKFMESLLVERTFQGELAGAFAGENVRVDRLLLTGRGFNLKGKGELRRRLNLTARISDLSGLLPGAGGAVNADGWLRWRDGMLSAAAKGEGRNVAAAGVSATALRVDARLGEGEDFPLYLDAALSGFAAGGFRADKALLNLQGTAARHRLDASLTSSQSEAKLALAGGYDAGVWKGELTRFSGHDGVGPWTLVRPASLLFSSESLRVSPLIIDGAPGERVELAAALNHKASTGELHAGWGGVNLERANPWLTGMELTGASSGDLRMRLLPNRRVALTANAYAEGVVETEGARVELQRVAARVAGDRSGLHAEVDVALEEGAGEARFRFDSPDAATLALPRRGDLQLRWSDLDLALLHPAEAEGDLILEGRSAGLVAGQLLPGGRLNLTGNGSLEQGHVNWRAKGDELDASIDTAAADFRWRGRLADPAKGELELRARAEATGSYSTGGERIAFGRLALTADADRSGTRAALDLVLDEGGVVMAKVSSDSPALAGIPERADLSLRWGGINPALLRPWLPGDLNLEGVLGGQAVGKLLPGQRLEMTGEAEFAQGKAKWQGENGELQAKVRSALLAWQWRDQTLSGTLTLALADYGSATGRFLLPIPARIPVAPRQGGAVSGEFAGNVRERGFLTTFFPGLVQETQGDLDFDVRLAGSWSEPRVSGELYLSRAGAYIPSAGIRLTDLELSAGLVGDRLLVDSFAAKSGKGRIEGSASARLDGWQLAEYSGKVSGTDFQTIYLPELQMVTSPDLTFTGGRDSLTLRGEIRVPEMLVSGPPVREVVTPSGDVIMEGAPPAPEEKPFPLAVDGRVKVVLGDKVEVQASGIDARLAGGIDLVIDGVESVTSSGEIRVAKGRYRAYGLDLEIVRGRLYYVDDPVDQPTLDILALRKVGDVSAGVTVAGYLNAPIVKLYSEPPMPEVDILAYMMLGHPLGAGSTEQGAMLATAAASLFSLGDSSSVQEQVKDRLGLSVLGLQTIDTAGSGTMGYKEIPVGTPTGAASPAQPTAGESLFTVGKYLTPELYLSYGRSLVTGANLFLLRYDITRRIQLETQSGTESGVDIYYKMEFN